MQDVVKLLSLEMVDVSIVNVQCVIYKNLYTIRKLRM